jgi:hypothetical protein
MTGWDGVSLWRGASEIEVRERLAAGADPCAAVGYDTALHVAAEHSSPAVVAAMAAAAGDVDVLVDGRSPLWLAVHARRHDNARVLAAAGADPWQSMMAGWSPGRLSLAGPDPELFGAAPAGAARSTDTSEMILLSYLCRLRAPAYACAFAGLRPVDSRCITGPADHWVMLADQDYWARETV